ncbi:MAG: hypothetical protein M5U19_08665 [Microthrixaceae bacterium]|nr:hypothetical protein [Microthrixaceae bacterium]
MRLRHMLPIPLLLLGALVAPACSSDDSSDTASGSSNERESGADTGDTGDTGDSGDSGSNPDEVPGLDDLTESIPGLDDMGDCITQATAFSSLYLEALGGEDGRKGCSEEGRKSSSRCFPRTSMTTSK